MYSPRSTKLTHVLVRFTERVARVEREELLVDCIYGTLALISITAEVWL